MSFPCYIFLFHRTTNKPNIIKTTGKEEESDYTQFIPSCLKEKASVSAFRKTNFSGSVTVEAVLCIPLFLYAAICLIWMLELRAIQIRVRSALHEAGKKMSVELMEVPILIPSLLEGEVINALGEDWIERSFIKGKIDCGDSYSWTNTGIMELKASYQVKLPIPFFNIPTLKYEETMRMKVWNGYVKGGFTGLGDIQEIVYVTETGVVYHKDYHCNYLEPSIRGVSKESLTELRNENGGKYYPCGSCGKNLGDRYYITDYGDRYHSSLSCSRIKRKIYAVTVSEVKGKGACSKCGN